MKVAPGEMRAVTACPEFVPSGAEGPLPRDVGNVRQRGFSPRHAESSAFSFGRGQGLVGPEILKNG
jgi:hypothetical protein